MKHDFDSLRHPKAGVPSTQYTYRNAAGNPVVIANRYERSEGGKFFLPFDVQRRAWKAPEVRPIYNLDKITNADPTTPIIFVEGEKCADALSALGYLTTTTFGGSKADKKSDLSPLSGRNVILWPDFDDPGLSYPRSVAGTLYKLYTVYARIIPISYDTLCRVFTGKNGPNYPKGWDVADGIADGWRAEHIEKLLSLAKPFDDPPDKPTNPEPINLDSIEL